MEDNRQRENIMYEVGRSAYADAGGCFWEKTFTEQYVEMVSFLLFTKFKKKDIKFLSWEDQKVDIFNVHLIYIGIIWYTIMFYLYFLDRVMQCGRV